MSKFSVLCAALIVISAAAFAAPTSHVLDDFTGGVVAESHPQLVDGGSLSSEVWYDITNDTFGAASAGVMPIGGSPALQVDDGGFTNGVYAIYSAVVPFNDTFTVSGLVDATEASPDLNGIRAIQMGVEVNGAHRAANPSDLPVPTSASAEYAGTLDATDNSANAPETLTTGVFAASLGDDILIGLSTEIGPDYDANSGTWGASAYFVDDLTLNAQNVPVELSIFSSE